jgi:1-phosphofructokinase
MIVTLTANPNLDRTQHVETISWGSVNRSRRSSVYASGKGVNVSRMLAANGVATVAIFPSGGPNGKEHARLLEAEGVPFCSTPMTGDVRSVISIVEVDGTLTQFNEAGPELDDAEVAALAALTLKAAIQADFLVVSGSLPPGLNGQFYADIISAASGLGTPTALDTSAPWLREPLSAGPAVIKPNVYELAQATGSSPRSIGDVIRLADQLRQVGALSVLVSMGEDGVVLIGEGTLVHGELEQAPIASAAGAGDALLAGYLAVGGGPVGVAEGLAWAAAACREPGTAAPKVLDTDRAVVRMHDSVDTGRQLTSSKPDLAKQQRHGA